MAASLPFFRASESRFVGPRQILSQDTTSALAASVTTDFFQFIPVPLTPKQALFIELASIAISIDAGSATLGLSSLRLGAGALTLDLGIAVASFSSLLRPTRQSILILPQFVVTTDEILRAGGTPAGVQIQAAVTVTNNDAVAHMVTVFERVVFRIISGLGE